MESQMKTTPRTRVAYVAEVHENETFKDDFGRERSAAPYCVILDDTGERHTIYHSQIIAGIAPQYRKVGVIGTLSYITGAGYGLWTFTPSENQIKDLNFKL